MPKPFIWGVYNISDGTYLEFWFTEHFVTWARQKEPGRNKRKIIYAHNGGKFDWHYVLGDIPKHTRLKVINGRLSKFKIGETEFRDSYNILPFPLALYKKDDIDYAKMEKPVRDGHMPEIRRYLKNDCVYLAELIEPFREENGDALTLAGAAMKQHEKISGEKADRTDRDFFETFDKYYAGGRVQCFEQGEIFETGQSADINSAYPAAMMLDHPYGDTYADIGELPDDDTELSRCFIRLTCKSRGAFFYRSDRGKLGFPSDGKSRTFHCTGWEYLAARDTGALEDVEIHSVIQFARSINFKPYVDHWYARKAAAVKNSADYWIAKYFLNALYGKWAADPRSYRDFMVMDLCDAFPWIADNDNRELENIEGDLAFVSEPTPEAQQRFYNVATAASITGNVRSVLWRAICQSKGPVYCDTDNLKARDLGSLDIDPSRLGAWSIEFAYTYGAIAAKKVYAFKKSKPDKKGKEWSTASKGVKLTHEEIIRVARGEVVEWESEAPTFRLGKNVLYDKETEDYYKRRTMDDPLGVFQSRKVRMVRTTDRELDIPWPRKTKTTTPAKPLVPSPTARAAEMLWSKLGRSA